MKAALSPTFQSQWDPIHSYMQGNLNPNFGQLVLHSENEPYSDV